MTLRNEPLSARVFASAVLATLAVGYSLALVYLYAQEVRPHRLEGHGLVQGVASTYHGVPGESRLLLSLKGTMASTVTPEEYGAIEAWVEGGAGADAYPEVVAPIIENNCVACHDVGGYPPPLTTVEEVQAVAAPGSGMSLQRLSRMTHVHLLAIPLLFFMLGSFFVRTRFREGRKASLVVLPFLGVLWDVAHWWLTRMNPSAAVGVVFGGVLMNLGFLFQWTMTAWDLWLPAPRGVLEGKPASPSSSSFGVVKSRSSPPPREGR
jgi:uncharacterized membrane protein